MSFNRPFKPWFPSRQKSEEKTLLENRISELERDLQDAGAENARANEAIQRLQQQLDDERRYNSGFERERFSYGNMIRGLRRELEDTRFQLNMAYDQLKEMEKLSIDYAAVLKEKAALQKKLDIRDKKEKTFERNSSSGSLPFKKNTPENNRSRQGGASKGHLGHGRKMFDLDSKDVITEYVDGSPDDFSCCPGSPLSFVEETTQSVLRVIPMKIQKYVLIKKVYECAHCGKRFTARSGDVLPRSLYANSMICELLFEIFICFGTVSAVAQRLGILTGTVFNILDRVAGLFEPCYEQILLELRDSHYLHADETRWRIDGNNGYAWLFVNDDIAAYLFRDTRASCVPSEIFGYRAGIKLLQEAKAGDDTVAPDDKLIAKNPESSHAQQKANRPLVVSDRYTVYGMLDVQNQYCFAHLLRDMEGIKTGLKEIPKEVEAFCNALAPLLAESMHLSANRELSDECYYKKAAELKKSILEIVEADAQDGGIQAYQHIWRSKKESLFKWTEDRRIPCENNRAERTLRPVVIARKTAFGSQGEKGRRAREILMTVLHTVRQRGIDVRKFIMDALAAKVRDKEADLSQLLKPPVS